MDAKHRFIQILGWISIVASYVFGLLLLRGIFVGLKGGFAGSRSHAGWIIFGCLLFFSVAVYFFNLGRRALAVARGEVTRKARFGWGRILAGTAVLFGKADERFHLLPAGTRRLKAFESSNATQAVAMNVTAAVLCTGCVLLILWGIWKGFAQRPTAESSHNA